MFVAPRDRASARATPGTFAGAALEPLATKGDDNMSDVRALLEPDAAAACCCSRIASCAAATSIADVLLCKRAADDRLECADDGSAELPVISDRIGAG